MNDEKQVAISLRDLKEILAEQAKQNSEQLKAVITELRKPTVIEQQKLDAEAAALAARNAERKDNSAAMLQKIENTRQLQRICTHQHPDGNTHCVYVFEQHGPGYIICQKNQCIIRPGDAPSNYKGNDIYDTALFNRLFQTLPSNELFQ